VTAQVEALNNLEALNESTLMSIEQDNALALFPRLRME
jgi:hypothetical protein